MSLAEKFSVVNEFVNPAGDWDLARLSPLVPLDVLKKINAILPPKILMAPMTLYGQVAAKEFSQ